jgi:hypothetical protein
MRLSRRRSQRRSTMTAGTLRPLGLEESVCADCSPNKNCAFFPGIELVKLSSDFLSHPWLPVVSTNADNTMIPPVISTAPARRKLPKGSFVISTPLDRLFDLASVRQDASQPGEADWRGERLPLGRS